MNNKKMKRYLDLLKSNGFQFKNKNFYGKEGQFLEYLVAGDNLLKSALCNHFNTMFNENMGEEEYVQVVGLYCKEDFSECGFFADFSCCKLSTDNFIQFVEKVLCE